MKATLIGSNVLMDQSAPASPWYDWSAEALPEAGDLGQLAINPLVYAEVSVGFRTREELDELLPEDLYQREDLPWEAAFLAGRCFVAYRRRGGARASPLPDFYIGAHALVRGYRLLTRDARRYRSYFPTLDLIAPPAA